MGSGFLLALFLPFSSSVFALSPMVQFQDLVAGEGDAGFEDGAFYSARFNLPSGLCLNEDGSVLYVADSSNNRIRAIFLDKKNEVETLAGTGKTGRIDGPLSIASFNHPTALAALPDAKIAVNDLGNNLIRLIDLKNETVSTLAEVSSPFNMAYLPSDQSLYFSQPGSGTLSKLDLKTHLVETILINNPLLPRPAALCVSDGKLFLADLILPGVYELQMEMKKPEVSQAKPLNSTPIPTATPILSVSLRTVGSAHKVLALAGLGKSLYAFQADTKEPIFRLYPDSAPITFVSIWGDQLLNPEPGNLLRQFQGITNWERAGFIADTRSEGRYYLTNPSYGIISTFRDLRFAERLRPSESVNSGGIVDFEYPLIKPAHTFRILLVGRSYLFYTADDHKFEKPGLEAESVNLMDTLANRMQLYLNTRAALEDVSLHFEVFNGGMHHANNEMNVWSYYVVPPIVKKYDVDLVVLLKDPGLGFNVYFQSPLDSQGVPVDRYDPEFDLLPNSKKFKSGTLHDFFELCKTKKMMQPLAENQWVFPDIDSMVADPEIEKNMINIIGTPLRLLRKKMDSMGVGEQHPRLVYCYFPISQAVTSRGQRTFWKDLSRDAGVSFLDLCDDLTVLGMTYYPYSATMGSDHFTVNGMNVFSTVLAFELIQNKIIPFEKTAAK